jgi:6-phosphogluconolactonase
MSDGTPDLPPGISPYSLETEPTPPPLPGDAVVARRDVDQLYHALGADLLIHAQNCVREFGDFHLALSGGSTPLPFYRALMTDPAFRRLPWKFTHLWLVDERRVPETDVASNWKQISAHFAHHADIPEDNLHPMHADREGADVAYERTLREHLLWREKGHDRLDFVLLGMGDDAHTASLFPDSPALRERDRLVVFNEGPSVTPPPRLTMTFPLINAARYVAVLVTGSKKRATLSRVAEQSASTRELPILGVKPLAGVMKWFLDAEACPE